MEREEGVAAVLLLLHLQVEDGDDSGRTGQLAKRSQTMGERRRQREGLDKWISLNKLPFPLSIFLTL